MNSYNTLERVYKPLMDLLHSYPLSWKNQRLFRSLITDYYPIMKMERNLILACVDEQVPHELYEISRLSRIDFNRLTKRVEDSYGYPHDKAFYAIAIWVKAIGVRTDADYETEISRIAEKYSTNNDYDDVSAQRSVYKHGYVEYETLNVGVAITNIVYNNPELIPSNTVIFVPEHIDNKSVIAIRPDALNELRGKGYSTLVVPRTIISIGEKNVKLYMSYETDKPKRLEIFFSLYSYNELDEISDSDVLFGRECENGLSPISFLNIKPLMLRSNYFEVPEDGIWSKGDKFYRYLGDKKTITVSNKEVCEYAFYKSKINKIILSNECSYFDKNMIVECDELKTIVFKAGSWCFFKTNSIRDCMKLEHIEWPRLIDSNNISIYSGCPLLGDMVINRALLTCNSKDEIYVVDDEIKVINVNAFCNCTSKIVIIPQSVDEIHDDAFKDSKVQVVIIEGAFTKWKPSNWGDNTYIYMAQGGYAAQYSNFKKGRKYKCYLKKIDLLEGYIGSHRDFDIIKSIVIKNMDKQSDSDLLMKRDDERLIIATADRLIKRTNDYIDMYVHPSPEGTQLGDNYDPEKYIKRPVEQNGNVDKFGLTLGNRDGIPF